MKPTARMDIAALQAEIKRLSSELDAVEKGTTAWVEYMNDLAHARRVLRCRRDQ